MRVILKGEQEKKLAMYIDHGITGDASAMGLANKFELEACNEYLQMDVGVVPMRVSRKFENWNVFYCNEVYYNRDSLVTAGINWV